MNDDTLPQLPFLLSPEIDDEDDDLPSDLTSEEITLALSLQREVLSLMSHFNSIDLTDPNVALDPRNHAKFARIEKIQSQLQQILNLSDDDDEV